MWDNMVYFKVALLLLTAASAYGKVDNLEKIFKLCDRNSPEVNDCLIDAIQDGISTMAGGIKELGAPPIDPYFQKELRVDYKNNQIAIKMIMKNIRVFGQKHSKVKDVRLRADEDNFMLEIDMMTPKVFVNGSYHAEGGWSSLFVNASGEFNTTMKNLVYTWKVRGKPEKMNGETFIRINSFYMRPDLSDLRASLTNNVPETKEIVSIANNFANTNWRPLYRELLPYAQDNWNKIGIRISNKVFLKVPYDQLFPAKS